MTDKSEYMECIRKRSGEVQSNSLLVGFLYILMRDHLTPGKVEGIMFEHCSPGVASIFTNGWLAKYAEDVANRLLCGMTDKNTSQNSEEKDILCSLYEKIAEQQKLYRCPEFIVMSPQDYCKFISKMESLSEQGFIHQDQTKFCGLPIVLVEGVISPRVVLNAQEEYSRIYTDRHKND